MKIVKVEPMINKFLTVKFKNRVKKLLQMLLNAHALDPILDEYSEDDILNSINAIYCSGSYIMLRDSSYNGKILRLLQFGGPKLKALNVLSMCSAGMEE